MRIPGAYANFRLWITESMPIQNLPFPVIAGVVLQIGRIIRRKCFHSGSMLTHFRAHLVTSLGERNVSLQHYHCGYRHRNSAVSRRAALWTAVAPFTPTLSSGIPLSRSYIEYLPV